MSVLTDFLHVSLICRKISVQSRLSSLEVFRANRITYWLYRFFSVSVLKHRKWFFHLLDKVFEGIISLMLVFRQIITISTGYEFTSRGPQANQNDEKSRPAMHEYDQWFRSCSAFIPRYWRSYRNICLIYVLTDNMNKRYHKLNNMHTMANK